MVVVGADWLVSKVTVILLIVGHRPVSQPFPGGDLLCLSQTARRSLPAFTQYPMTCISAAPLHNGDFASGTILWHGTLPGQD